MIGRHLGHYEILEEIGAGGMGIVYRARDRRLERAVALKVLPPGRLGDEDSRRRFRREALALSRLNHPAIATIHDFDSHDGIDLLVMEYIPGVTLSDRLAAGPLPEKDVLRLGAQLADGLAAAHERGIVHRDLKPGNLRITPDGRLKILDFGLASLLRPPSELGTTDSVADLPGAGTPPYMAPEQLRGEARDPRSDIYAAGAVLYEAVTGRRPFPQAERDQLISAILHGRLAPPSELCAEISPGLERVLLKALDRDPSLRYQSALELRVDLERLSAGAPLSGGVPPRPRAFSRGLALLLLAVAACGAGLLLLRERRTAIDSLAVLPFDNEGADPGADYLSDGITESLLNSVAQLPQLRVMGRASVFRYKGRAVDPLAAGRELGVRAVLTGRVRQRGDGLWVSAELLDVREDRHLWGERYSRKLVDVFSVQEDIAQEIAAKLRLHLNDEERTRLGRRYTDSTAAYQFFLKGDYFRRRGGEEAQRSAIRCFEQAIEADAGYALAYVGLSRTYLERSIFVRPREAMPKARDAAQRALELDRSLAEAHVMMAEIKMTYDWDWAGAEREFKQALVLGPGLPEAHHAYSHYLINLGRLEESLAESERALALDPLDPEMNAHLGFHYLHSGPIDQAIAQYQRALALEPQHWGGRLWLAVAYERGGRYEEAIATVREVLAEHQPEALSDLGYAYALAGRREEAAQTLRQMPPPGLYARSFDVALIHVALGDKEQAFHWLEEAYQERDGALAGLKEDPRLESLRGDPRFQSLVRRIGLTP